MKKIGRQDEKRGVCVGIVCLLALTFMKVEGAAIAVAPVGQIPANILISDWAFKLRYRQINLRKSEIFGGSVDNFGRSKVEVEF